MRLLLNLQASPVTINDNSFLENETLLHYCFVRIKITKNGIKNLQVASIFRLFERRLDSVL